MKTSDKILLGIYTRWKRLDEHIYLEAAELAWVAQNGIKGWEKDDGWEVIRYPSDTGSAITHLEKPYEDLNSVAVEMSLLQATDCIEFVRPSCLKTMFRVTLLPCGFQRAVKLSSRKGRADLWYCDNRNGLFGLAITIIVSFVTALFTSMLAAKSGPTAP